MDNNFNWNSVNDESVFLKLENRNQLRMGSNFKVYGVHIEEDLMQNKKRVNCPESGCPLCMAGKAPIKRYAFKVINRANGQAYIVEAGIMIMKEIKKYAQNPNYGDPMNYDLLITKTGTDKQTKYTVKASPNKTPLTPDEIELLGAIDIDKYIKPNSIEDIKAIGFMCLPIEVVSNEEPKIDDDDWNSL